MNTPQKLLIAGAVAGAIACVVNREMRAARRRPPRTLAEAEAQRRSSVDDLPELQPSATQAFDEKVAPTAPF